MNITIRHELPSDYYQTESAARDSFWNLYFPGAHEHFVLHKMRTHKDFIQELSFIILIDEKVAGGIFYTHSKIVTKHGEYPTITFGPVFISPPFQRKGFGRQLITHSIEKAKSAGHEAILTLGYPYHYEPYGFCGAKKYAISMEDGLFYKGLLALPLTDSGLKNKDGFVVFSDVFRVDNSQAEAFDSSFPKKKKLILPCQEEYEKACALLDI